jgi:predicted 2-oxoglutarate/Fe(II)-dependent dioxygenase YbiX/peroxiredoxin
MTTDRPLPLQIGQPAPWFRAPAVGGCSEYAFDTAAGRIVLMLFIPSASDPEGADALAKVRRSRAIFDDAHATFFGVTADPDDVAMARIAPEIPGIRFFLDSDRRLGRAFGAAPADGEGSYFGHWLLLDRSLRAAGTFPLSRGDEALEACYALASTPPDPDWAPVLMVPNVLEPSFCQELIALYERHGGIESGFMRDVGGRTKLMLDPNHKIRRDYSIQDPELKSRIHRRFRQRLLPLVQRTFQFTITRIERLIVGCYQAADGGHFNAHRDNTTNGTAHRRFAATINLNTEDYEGGDLVFPEFGPRAYRAPTGGAIIFSCSLLHRALPVTKGRRFALLPFFYDEAAATQREDNGGSVEGELANYRAGAPR